MAAPWRVTLKRVTRREISFAKDRELLVNGFALLQSVTGVQMDAESQRDLLDFGKMISPEDYIEQRLDDQIGWYDRKSASNRFALFSPGNREPNGWFAYVR
jgi:hypothetical protein